MTRAAEKQRDSARYRASLARLTRARVEVPERENSMFSLRNAVGPIAIAALWGANWWWFMR